MIYCGIDPGKSGAIALIMESNIIIFDYEDPEALIILRKLYHEGAECQVMIEEVHAMPGQGVTSMFSFGMNYGGWVERFKCFNFPFAYVRPQIWQKEMFKHAHKFYIKKTVIKKGIETVKKKLDTKKTSLEHARELYPELSHYFLRKKDDGRADALHIAQYCKLIRNTE